MGANALARGWIWPHLLRAMKRWTPRQLIALVLGVVFALGISLSAVQATEMAVKMSAAAAMGTVAPDGCGGGCGGDDDTASADSCVMVCPNAFQAVVPASGPIVTKDVSESRPGGQFPSAGRSSYPDPHPPKPVIPI